jgi:hypothetical protein
LHFGGQQQEDRHREDRFSKAIQSYAIRPISLVKTGVPYCLGKVASSYVESMETGNRYFAPASPPPGASVRGGAMRYASESGRLSGFCKILFLACLSLYGASLLAQKSQDTGPPKYNLQTETKMNATVEEVKLPPKGSEKEVAHLLVKNGTETVDVYLCPKSFLGDMGMSFSKGDEIALTGSKVKHDGADLILAREVVKGTDTLLLRDDKGRPVWNAHR